MAYSIRRVLEFRETDIFTREVTALLTDDEYAELQGALIVEPEAGDLIPAPAASGKLRWGQQRVGRGSGAGFASSTTGTKLDRSFTCCSSIRKPSKTI
jgi:hypothetical protein